MYFIQKDAVYFHGIFWIGEDLEEAETRCNAFCNADKDYHHDWVVYKFGLRTDDLKDLNVYCYDADHEAVYTATRKGMEGSMYWAD